LKGGRKRGKWPRRGSSWGARTQFPGLDSSSKGEDSAPGVAPKTLTIETKERVGDRQKEGYILMLDADSATFSGRIGSHFLQLSCFDEVVDILGALIEGEQSWTMFTDRGGLLGILYSSQ
jgi:hypothetical protein